MHVIHARNVAQALPLGVAYLLQHGQRSASRAGPVLVAPGPVTTAYARPTERVLHSAVRDANPFFHLAESLWMLAERNDAAFLNRFVADFGARFAESASGNSNMEADGRVHGAYGHRWRQALGLDQLDAVVQRLRANPDDRQCVVQMWDATPIRTRAREHAGTTYYEQSGCDDLRGVWKDRPCNTHAYLRVRSVLPPTTDENSADNELRVVHGTDKVLDITVCCRSNDIVWGAYGANAVHFSVLQEYLAARVGVGVGTYYQVSNNYHMYVSELERLERRSALHSHENQRGMRVDAVLLDDRDLPCPLPLVNDPEVFDLELAGLLHLYETDKLELHLQHPPARNSWLSGTAAPVLLAHAAFKCRAWATCYGWLQAVQCAHWRTACTEWIERRRK